MKYSKFLVVVLAILLLFSFTVSAAQVSITPGNPNDNDNLTCNIDGVAPNDLARYSFQWHVNGAQDKTIGNTWVYPFSKTKTNDFITCVVFAPGGFFVGLDSKTIAAIQQPKQNNPPSVNIISPASGSNFFKGNNINFNALASDLDNDPLFFTWDFGDGFISQGILNPNHIYNLAGNYLVKLTVSDGKVDVSDSIILNIVDPMGGQKKNPSAVIDAQANAKVGDFVLFRGDRSFDPDGNIVNYEWDFGDGIKANGPVVQHQYNLAGNYAVSLTVTDNDGLKNAVVVFVNVVNQNVLNQVPVAVIELSAANLIAGEPFDAKGIKSFDPDGNIVNYEWDFGDGRTHNGVNARLIYPNPGNYKITLTVTDDKGAKGTTSTNVVVNQNVLNQAPVAVIDASSIEAFLGFPIRLSGSRSFDPDGNIVNYEWNFDDGTIADGEFIEHTFFNPGIYNVVLTVTDDKGATGSKVLSINAGNVNRGPDFDKLRVDHKKNNDLDDNYRDTRIARLMPLNFKNFYNKGENFALLAKLVNEGTANDVVDVKVSVPEFNYVRVVKNVHIEANEVKWVMLNVEIPVSAASGVYVVKVELLANKGFIENNKAFWDFVVA
ncbi:PKD domain-containing protein [Candidatus Woesearchaeota archaeon]|nr:PKD domain-containing protein [Candidatus Woesearchaeota archaeon]